MKLAYYIWETYTGGGLMKTTIDKMTCSLDWVHRP